MKKLYIAPEMELLCLASEERLASSNTGSEIDFDSMMQNGGGGVSANPNVDIDVPIIKG